MELLLPLVAVLAASLTLNVVLVLKLRAARKKPQPTTEASQLLHDLTANGGALVRLTVMDPEGLLMWRGGA